MQANALLFILPALVISSGQAVTYSNLWIPPAISGATFNLSLNVTNTYYLPGSNTIT